MARCGAPRPGRERRGWWCSLQQPFVVVASAAIGQVILRSSSSSAARTVRSTEQLDPSTGTWPRFRGRVGTVVEINEDRKRPHLTEYGVSFGKVTRSKGNRHSRFAWDPADSRLV